MQSYSDELLVKIYNACKSAENNYDQGNSDFLLEIFNKFFKRDLGFLHFYMVLELFEMVEKELASRFVAKSI